MRYTDIPVHIGDKRIFVTYDYTETPEKKEPCVVTSEGKEMRIDNEFKVLSSDMPHEWAQPIIEELKKLIAGQGM
ncbi:hypothetical protein [Pedobacter panaciterrae]|uniref:hypothetical protein n=1 Tax=Pedobacter panaciterrae TaxID=363849 RepID=UPI0025986B8A|nr:hypothetical protein [uncultured Pedobacter sp.]